MIKQKIKSIKLTEYNVNSPKVEGSVKFAFVSDLHNCPYERIVEEIKKVNPHAVLVGGDFVHDKENYSLGIDFLKAVSRFFPVFAVIGNHEKRVDTSVKSLLDGTEVNILDDSAVDFKGIRMGGLTSGHSGEVVKGLLYRSCPNLDFLEDFDKSPAFKLLLCHHPEYYKPYIKPTKIDLVLSGHAHGGQWRLFGMGAIAPGQGIFPKYTCGLYEKRLIVSRGIGNPRPIPRINNPPEIVVINISSQK